MAADFFPAGPLLGLEAFSPAFEEGCFGGAFWAAFGNSSAGAVPEDTSPLQSITTTQAKLQETLARLSALKPSFSQTHSERGSELSPKLSSWTWLRGVMIGCFAVGRFMKPPTTLALEHIVRYKSQRYDRHLNNVMPDSGDSLVKGNSSQGLCMQSRRL